MENTPKYSPEQIIQNWLKNLKNTLIGQICAEAELLALEQSLRQQIAVLQSTLIRKFPRSSLLEATLQVITRLGYTDQTIIVDRQRVAKAIPEDKWQMILQKLDKMNIPSFSKDTQHLVAHSLDIAKSYEQTHVISKHILLALIEDKSVLNILHKLSISEEKIKELIQQSLPQNNPPLPPNNKIALSKTSSKIFMDGWREVNLQESEVSPKHIMLSLLWKTNTNPMLPKNIPLNYVLFRLAMTN